MAPILIIVNHHLYDKPLDFLKRRTAKTNQQSVWQSGSIIRRISLNRFNLQSRKLGACQKMSKEMKLPEISTCSWLDSHLFFRAEYQPPLPLSVVLFGTEPFRSRKRMQFNQGYLCNVCTCKKIAPQLKIEKTNQRTVPWKQTTEN